MNHLPGPYPTKRKPKTTPGAPLSVNLLLFCMIMLMACQKEQQSTEQSTQASEDQLQTIAIKYQQKIDSILQLQSVGDTALQNKLEVLEKTTQELRARNESLDNEIDQQANAIQKLQDSLASSQIGGSGGFTPVALTDESLTTLTKLEAEEDLGVEEDTLFAGPYAPFEEGYSAQALAQEVDSLIQEIDKRESRVAERDQRIDGILSNLAIAIEPKSKSAGTGYEEVIISTLLSTVADDTLIVNQYDRGFYSKQDLNALISDYQIRKKQSSSPGQLVIYRRKKKQSQKTAILHIDGKPYSFARNQVDTVKVADVFNVTFCDDKEQCRTLSFSTQLKNYVEVSLRKNKSETEFKAVNEVLGEFYAKQVNSSRK